MRSLSRCITRQLIPSNELGRVRLRIVPWYLSQARHILCPGARKYPLSKGNTYRASIENNIHAPLKYKNPNIQAS